MRFLDYVSVNPKISLEKERIYPFVEMGDVSTSFRNPDKVEYKSFDSGVKFADGDTVIARITPCLQNGKRFYCKNIGKGFGSTEYLVFRPKDSSVDNLYLYYFMNTDFIKESMVRSMVGATGRQRVNNDVFSRLDVTFPNIEIQRRIAEILSTYDDLIENNRKQIKLLEEAAQRLYKEWFVDLRFPGHENTKITDGVPEGWRRERLVDLVDVQYGYAFDGSQFNATRNGMPIIRIRNIPSGNTCDYTTEKVDVQYVVHNGDILVGMDGEFHINSWSGPDAYLVQRTCSFRPNKSSMKGYLLQAIYEPIKFFESTVVGATVAHPGKKHIDTISVLTCPDNLYVPFQKYYEQRQLLLNQNWLLTEARDRLLPKLMSGEIEV